jgi:hypothetical protein
MEIKLNRPLVLGVLIASLTTITALLGEPKDFAGYSLPLWELLLQLNLCTGFVFVIVGVLESVETPMPDFSLPTKLFGAAFLAYVAVCVICAASLGLPFSALLFLFTLSLACMLAGWGQLGLSLLRLLDPLE